MRILLGILLFLVVLPAQQPPVSQTEQPVIRAVTQEVLLDLVVRDKRGQLVRDLKPEEIEVSDDGVPVKLTAFRLVSGQDAAGLGSHATASADPEQYDPLRQLRLVTLVYEGLDNESRRLAQRASMDFLRDGLEQNVYVSVFVISERLRVLQPFTNDLNLLRQAVDRATTFDYPQFLADSEQIRRQLEEIEGQAMAAAQAVTSSVPGRGSSDSGGVAAAAAAAQMAQATLNILNFEESLTRSQQARSSLFSLLALVKEQRPLPGRKTVIYFTRGLQVPENMIELLNTTIAASNRAGVSVYGIDARGLTLDAQNASSISMLNSAAIASRRQQENPQASVTPEQVKAFDTAMSSIHANTQQSLANLATSTGGFLVANTNDLRQPLRRVREELLTYYEVSYVPPITEYDGRFRKISVRVSRPDVKVQARSGYFALPPGQDSVFAYELPLLKALSSSPLPRALPFQVAALRFGEQNGKVEHSLAVEIPLAALAATEDKENQRYMTRLSVLAMLKDQQGKIVERFSRDFPFEVPADRLDEFQKRHFLQTWHTMLPPGRYTLESAVMDREGVKAAARRVSVMVLPPSPGVSLSSLTLVRRADPQSPEAGAGDPLHVQGNRMVPSLENAAQMSPQGGLSFFFVVYPAASETGKPQLFLELSKDGVPIGTVSPELPDANEKGEIPYVASLPMSNFQPGQYELRAVVKHGESAAEERTVFTINP